jgi:enoyl-[acyl-carrier protein] reductase I
MVEPGKQYVVMGLLNPASIAFVIGETIRRNGGKVVYTVQNAVLKRRYLDTSRDLDADALAALDVRLCDVSVPGEVEALFAELGRVAGVVHSIAYANPKTCLGEEFHTDAIEDVKQSYHVSCASLATVAQHAVPRMGGNGAVVTLSFSSRLAFAYYNWMGVHKAALEALVRYLARRHGRDGVRVNAVSAGPVSTTASSKIPGFRELGEVWQTSSPLPWDPVEDKQAIANAVAFLLGPSAEKITGQVLTVDGGASAVGGQMQDFEKPQGAG